MPVPDKASFFQLWLRQKLLGILAASYMKKKSSTKMLLKKPY